MFPMLDPHPMLCRRPRCNPVAWKRYMLQQGTSLYCTQNKVIIRLVQPNGKILGSFLKYAIDKGRFLFAEKACWQQRTS
jgi:hypothetical protein